MLMFTFITGRCLELITYHLQAIKDQNLILTTLLPEANKKKIDECVRQEISKSILDGQEDDLFIVQQS